MSKSHFIKLLTSNLYLGLIHRPWHLSPLLNTNPIYEFRRKPTSSLFLNTLLSSSVRPFTYVAASVDAPPPAAEEHPSAYLSVRIRCPKDMADVLSEALLCFGASSTSMDEEQICENSNEVCIDSIFPDSEDVDACLLRAADSIGLKGKPNYEVKVAEQCNWIQKTKEWFHPVRIAEGLWIVPEWRSPPDVQATNIILNPGLAFGTGEHPTTKLCLLLLKGCIKGGELFLDYGTGSGVLAIAALKFGAARSTGIDVDPQAITSARHNAALNNVGPETMELQLVPSKMYSTTTNERIPEVISEKEKYDVVIANILLNPLLQLADDIVSFAKPGAVVSISGILSEQLPDIVDRYSGLLEDISVTELDDWACASGRKKSL